MTERKKSHQEEYAEKIAKELIDLSRVQLHFNCPGSLIWVEIFLSTPYQVLNIAV